MAEVNPPAWQTGQCYDAGTFRGMIGSLVCGGGVSTVATGALAVTPVEDQFAVQVAAGTAFIEGTQVEDQGMYWVENDGPVVLEVEPSDPTDARIDLVVATVNDSEYFGTENNWVLQVLQGTPSPAPELPVVPDNSIILARLDIDAGALAPVQVTDQRSDYTLCANGTPDLLRFNAGAHMFRKADYPGARAFKVTLTGGGGGGGGAAAGAASESCWGAGGGAGGSVQQIYDPEDLPNNTSITVGDGGGGGSNDGSGGSTPGAAGGVSRFGQLLTAQGGGGGNGMNPGTGPNSVFGGSGGATGGSGMGARGGSGGMGIRLDGGRQGQTGFGGDSHWGGGGVSRDGSVAAQDGVAGGGGAGGSSVLGGPARMGGRGGEGVCVIEVL